MRFDLLPDLLVVRVDFNVPLDKATRTKVNDPKRIVAALPTIQYILNQGILSHTVVRNLPKCIQSLCSGPKSIVLMSHLGRPNGLRKKKFSLAPVVPVLEKLLRSC